MTTRDRNMLAGVAMVVLIAAFWFLALSPRRQQASDVHKQVEAAELQRDQATEQMAVAQTAQRGHLDDQAVIAQLGKALPDNDDTASLLYQLQDAAGRSHVILKSIAPSGANGAPAGNATAPGDASTPCGTPGPGGVTALPLNLTFAGTYRDLQRFIRHVHDFTSVKGDRIEVSGRLLSIDGFKLDAGQGSIEATINATAYIAAPETAAAGTGTPGTGTAAAGTTASGTTTTPATPTASAADPTVPATVVGAG